MKFDSPFPASSSQLPHLDENSIQPCLGFYLAKFSVCAFSFPVTNDDRSWIGAWCEFLFPSAHYSYRWMDGMGGRVGRPQKGEAIKIEFNVTVHNTKATCSKGIRRRHFGVCKLGCSSCSAKMVITNSWAASDRICDLLLPSRYEIDSVVKSLCVVNRALEFRWLVWFSHLSNDDNTCTDEDVPEIFGLLSSSLRIWQLLTVTIPFQTLLNLPVKF